MRLFLTILLLSGIVSAQVPLYEEELPASRPYRLENKDQLYRYASSLEPNAPLLHFKKLIGFPAPGLYEKARAARVVRAGEDSLGTYYRIWVPVSPVLDTYGLYIVPKNVHFPAPLVISLHGGAGTPELALFHGGSNYHDMIRGAVQHGYVVWAPLTVMSPASDRAVSNAFPSTIREDLDAKLRTAGTSLMGLEVTKITRALDRILERPEVDRSRVAMIGLSYGGYYTLYTAAVEPRIKVAVASCSFRNTPAAAPGTGTEGRPIDIASPEQVALVAPRPLQIQVGIHDQSAPIDTVRATAEFAKEYYEKAGKPERLDYEEFDGVHEWRGDVAWTFLAKYLGGDRAVK